jgi:hypothetical protein
MKLEQMTDEQVRKMYSGFIPDKIRARMAAVRQPTEAEIEAARALIARAEGKRGPGRPRAVEAAE